MVARAEGRYRQAIRNQDISELRYSHDAVSSTCRHDPHRGKHYRTLVEDLLAGMRPLELPALVAVAWQEAVWVICGNRRCSAIKDFVERQTYQPCDDRKAAHVRVIVHKFSELSDIRDEVAKLAFRLKATEAMDTRTQGCRVRVRGR